MMTTRYEDQQIAVKSSGRMTIMGTDWPIETTVTRISHPHRRTQWLVTFGICNGIASGSKEYHTRREALSAAGIS